MLGSVKAVLEDAQVFIEDDEIYLSLKYKDAKAEDGRIVRVQYPKIRLPIPTKALPDVEEKRLYGLGSKWFLKLGTSTLDLIPSKTTVKNGLDEEVTKDNIVYVVANQLVTLTEDEVHKILEEKYGCPVEIVKKGGTGMKIKMFSRYSFSELEQMVNNFIKDKEVINIQYQSYSICAKYNGNGIPIDIKCVDRVMIVYKEGTLNVL